MREFMGVSKNGSEPRENTPLDPIPDMGVSENSVPLNPMVNDHYPY